jgi:hypothetical protein
MSAPSVDLGPVIAWRALEEGLPVYGPDGREIGVVEEVLAPGEIFEGVVIHTRPLPGRHLVADHDQIASLHERGVVLAVGRDALREPGPPRGKGGRPPEPGWQRTLRRAWDRLMGWNPGRR